MSTTPIGSYKFFQKLHPLSLLAQLTSRRATGCLRVFTSLGSWSLYLEEGKLTYASCSERLFERLEHQLERLSQQISSVNDTTLKQVQATFETNSQTQSIPQADYQVICYLVDRDYITPSQAVIVIDELAKEVLESFLTLKEGSYEFNHESPLNELPQFCRLDLRLLVEHCQKQLRNSQNTHSSVLRQETNQMPTLNLPQTVSKTQIHSTTELSRQTKLDNSDNSQNKIFEEYSSKNTYTIACIDDSPTVLNSIKQFLDENTFLVVAINDPVKALMQILRSKPDIILLDIEMPNLDGYELCSLLRRHSAFKNTPIIMVTGRTGFLDRAKAKIVRSSGYLAKPFTQSDLLKILFKHLNP